MTSSTKHLEQPGFPLLEGESLARVPMTLPGDLEGDYSLVFVAFRQSQQKTIDRWLSRLGSIEDRYAGLTVYEVPLLKRYPSFFREWVDNGMRSGILDPRTRERTVTVYTDRSEFLRSTGVSDVSEIWVVLMDGDGTIYWEHRGAVNEQAVDGLERVLERQP